MISNTFLIIYFFKINKPLLIILNTQKMQFVKVAESDNPDDSVEIPVEPQGHILMSTLTAQFPGACGLKFKTEQSSWRG